MIRAPINENWEKPEWIELGKFAGDNCLYMHLSWHGSRHSLRRQHGPRDVLWERWDGNQWQEILVAWLGEAPEKQTRMVEDILLSEERFVRHDLEERIRHQTKMLKDQEQRLREHGTRLAAERGPITNDKDLLNGE